MNAKQYLGVMMLPTIVYTVLTLIITLMSGNLFWGLMMGMVIGGGAGDFAMGSEIIKQPGRVLFKDPPSEPGFYVIR